MSDWIEERRYGHIIITRQVYEELAYRHRLRQALFDVVLPTRMGHRFESDHDVVIITAVSALFQPVPRGNMTPSYRLTIEERRHDPDNPSWNDANVDYRITATRTTAPQPIQAPATTAIQRVRTDTSNAGVVPGTQLRQAMVERLEKVKVKMRERAQQPLPAPTVGEPLTTMQETLRAFRLAVESGKGYQQQRQQQQSNLMRTLLDRRLAQLEEEEQKALLAQLERGPDAALHTVPLPPHGAEMAATIRRHGGVADADADGAFDPAGYDRAMQLLVKKPT